MNEKATLLVIDDEAITRRATVRMLNAAGYQVLEAANGQTGLQIAQDNQPDLILLDVLLPDINGLQVCRQLKTDPRTAHCIVVLHSSYKIESADQADGLDSGADAYVLRTASSRELLTQVTALLRIKHSGELLQQSQAKFQALFDVLPIGVSMLDAERRVIDVNPALEKILGLSREELLSGKYSSRKYLGPDGAPMLPDQFPSARALRENRVIADVEIEIVTEAGQSAWVSVGAAPVPLPDLRVVVTTQDITARKLAERSLRRERDLIARLMETSPAAIVQVNPEGRITFANPRAEQVLGLTKSEITQRAYNAPEWRATDYAGNPWPDEAQPFVRVMRTGQPVYGIQHAIEWPNGRRVFLVVNGAPLFGETGQVESVVFAIEDVTERKQAEQERIAQLEREVELLARMASQPPTTVTAQSFGLAPLRAAAPPTFDELTQKYARLLAQAVEAASYKVEYNISDNLRAMADRLGNARAGPRDVIDLHMAALQRTTASMSPPQAQVYAEEGRLLVLELMGYLAAFYRSRAKS